MSLNTILRNAAAAALAVGLLAQCRKGGQESHQNMDLSNSKLEDVQSAVYGRWELRELRGGICGGCPHEVRNNPYLILSADRASFGNDSLGVTEEGSVSWQPADLFGSGYYFRMPSGSGYSPREIRNDTLLILEYSTDGMTQCYTRSR